MRHSYIYREDRKRTRATCVFKESKSVRQANVVTLMYVTSAWDQPYFDVMNDHCYDELRTHCHIKPHESLYLALKDGLVYTS